MPPLGEPEYCLQNAAIGAMQHVLVLPAWFDEHNKLRHFTAEVMRLLGVAGIAASLPDLPGCNESPAPLRDQDITLWRGAAAAAGAALGCTHVLAIRAGANIAPALPGWAYAPLAGSSALKTLLRARVMASREAGLAEDRETLLVRGRAEGLELAGYALGPAMVRDLASTSLPDNPLLQNIEPAALGGPGLWLRAEPDHDEGQAAALAQILIAGLRA